MSVSSSLHCDDKIFPETHKEDLYHVGVSITVPRGLLSNSHTSHVTHFYHLQLSCGFQMSYCHWQPFVKQPSEHGFLAVSRAKPTWSCCSPSTFKHHVKPRQHLSTFSPPARKLKQGQTHLALAAWFLIYSHILLFCFLPVHLANSDFPGSLPGFSELNLPCPLAAAGNHTHHSWRYLLQLSSCRCRSGGSAAPALQLRGFFCTGAVIWRKRNGV